MNPPQAAKDDDHGDGPTNRSPRLSGGGRSDAAAAQAPPPPSNTNPTTTASTPASSPSPSLPKQPKPKQPKPPPQALLFDDGSRAMKMVTTTRNNEETTAATAATTTATPNRSGASVEPTPTGKGGSNNDESAHSLRDYYEIERICYEIQDLARGRILSTKNQQRQPASHPFLTFRVALQFPDEWLDDSVRVCWYMQDELQKFAQPKLEQRQQNEQTKQQQQQQQQSNEPSEQPATQSQPILQYMVFVLGDTTFASCCPDVVAANHLNADCLVHYGHACLSNTGSTTNGSVPIVYSFGRAAINVNTCIQDVLNESQQQTTGQPSSSNKRFLVFYEVCYAHAMEEFQTRLSEQGDCLVVMGEIPNNDTTTATDPHTTTTTTTTTPTNCRRRDVGGNVAAADTTATTTRAETTCRTKNTSSLSCCNAAAVTAAGGNGSDEYNDRISCCRTIAPSKITLQHPSNGEGGKNHHDVENDGDDDEDRSDDNDNAVAVGGLEIPQNIDLSTFTCLYIGNPTTRQYMNIVLRFLSSSGGGSTSDDEHAQQPKNALTSSPNQYWVWNPTEGISNNKKRMTDNESHNGDQDDDHKAATTATTSTTSALSTTLPVSFQRQLNRRFYMIQKARHANVFGILVANFSDMDHVRSIVASVRNLIDDYDDKASYTFVVGKINPNKLANFAEIDCFVLVACPEHSLLNTNNERGDEFHIPVITPLELRIALGRTEWGQQPYSLNPNDYLTLEQQQEQDNGINKDGQHAHNIGDDNDDDAPVFSLVTGQYVPKAKHKSSTIIRETTDLTQTVGRGQITEYKSAASDFLKRREYQGLTVNKNADDGDDDMNTTQKAPVHTAIQGQQGIASDYGK